MGRQLGFSWARSCFPPGVLLCNAPLLGKCFVVSPDMVVSTVDRLPPGGCAKSLQLLGLSFAGKGERKVPAPGMQGLKVPLGHSRPGSYATRGSVSEEWKEGFIFGAQLCSFPETPLGRVENLPS